MERMMSFTAQPAVRSRRIASIPVTPGMCWSRMAKSGLSAVIISTAAPPSPTWPRTRMPWEAQRAAMPSLTMAWSSANTDRNGQIRPECSDHFDSGATIADLAQDAHALGGAEGRDAFPHNGMVVGQYYGGRCQFLHTDRKSVV